MQHTSKTDHNPFFPLERKNHAWKKILALVGVLQTIVHVDAWLIHT